MIHGFDKIKLLNDYQKRDLKAKLRIQTGKEALLTEAIIALSDKFSSLITYNKINELDMAGLKPNIAISKQIPAFMKLSPKRKTPQGKNKKSITPMYRI
jgi:hypothetical protein